MQRCEICEANAVTVRWYEEKFAYGSGDDQVLLSAVVPVYECGECGEMHTGHEAEELRHEAVCRHLGRLTPHEIKAIRESYHLTQEKFADVSGFGVASIKRWELGNQIQGESANNLLLLLRMPHNLRLVQEANKKEAFQPTFRTKLSESTRQRSLVFKLRAPVTFEKAA
ncbi:putative zinc finger/helix-turn-helix YgiT family protein [Aminobacter aminovorans]|uniref:Putative zinc finger/helix-turn-helix protein, YgiT family n=2 Tax=Aminobacter aminovorans TaxID=83263 RepID=A0A380WPC5_AMIAI|nr:putative zinc finger/helix-turn-helix YgiT family protein [Aminobacter aminovorans]SUU90710.1 putative zinc finger/helix-turn-helix protein, YgiT family [Aminobacter aminovorans]